MTIKTRAVAYLRVSTEKQADFGVSLEAQRAKVEAYAQLYDLELVEVVVDAGASAKSLEREGLQRALGMLGRTADALLVVKLDRLTRSVRDLGHLVEKYFASGKAALLSVSEQVDTRSAAGRLVLNILTSIAEWERQAIGERTSAAMQHLKREGRFTGGEPDYGYARVGDQLQADPAEQTVIAEARRLRCQGLSLRAVARALEAQGMRSRVGKQFAAQQIARMTE